MSEEAHASGFHLVLPAHPDAITCVRHVLEGLLDHWPISRAQLDDVQIATAEACANVVVHAYRDRAPGQLEVNAEMVDDQPVITVRDHGNGVAPRPDSTGLGVGLALIAALTTELRIGPSLDGAHEVRMTFPGGGA